MKKQRVTQPSASLFTVLLVFFCLINPFLFAQANAADELFPIYPAIRANVSFWEMVYEKLSGESAVIHDRSDLSKIYALVTLQGNETPGAAQENQNILQDAEARCSAFLKALAQGKAPLSADEKRIAAMFSGPDAHEKLLIAAENVRSQRGLKERFQEGVQRSGAYMTEIKRIFSNAGLPQDLAYLPHVESSFNLDAYSKIGAAGIWQFTRSTGKQFLRINDAIDERLDPILATEAAARYLKNSYEALGEWPSALTSYNYGTAGMVRAKNAKGSYERIFSEYSEGYFKFAARNFYSEFLAAMQVAKRLEQTPGFALNKPKSTRMYVLPVSVYIGEIERHLKVGRETVQQLNPALRPTIIAGRATLPKGYALRLPSRSSDQIGSIPVTPEKSAKSNSKGASTHIVRNGETIFSIAQRYNISVNILVQVNKLPKSGRILVGQKLSIPQNYSKISISGSPLEKG